MSVSNTGLEIAILGMAGRFPGAEDLHQLWHNLAGGVESISRLSTEQMRNAGFSEAHLNDPNLVPVEAVIPNVLAFDAAFFAISPGEARLIDPQQRLFLECSWHALEDAGQDLARFVGSVGVYGGCGLNQYVLEALADQSAAAKLGLFELLLGNDKDYLATRVAYKLDLEGPAVTIQTACSTALVAVHLAAQALLNGECDMALAGAVSAGPARGGGYRYQPGMILSPDGHCRAFGAGAQGTVAGQGVGVVVLRRLADAVAAGDRIRAVIKGSAINNDGGKKVGYAAPRLEGQARVIRTAQLMAGVDAASIQYVEGHGTGTPLGDPIEVAALTRAFRATTTKRGFCALGSLKSNLGHLDAAAGVASLIKTVLALEHGKIPPTLHCDPPNPEIDFASSPFELVSSLRDWPADEGRPRRGAVSSFGIGGTNAHVIVEEAPPCTSMAPSRSWQVLTLSARTATALDHVTERLADSLERHAAGAAPPELADVAFTCQLGRRAFPHRRRIVTRDLGEAVAALRARDPRRLLTGLARETGRSIAFLLPGQGTQYLGMGAELFHAEPVFRREIETANEILRPVLGLDLRKIFGPVSGERENVERHLDETKSLQPILFVFEYALARLWRSWGIKPSALLGHSVGECVAACLAEVFSFAEGLDLVIARGRAMQTAPAGGMLAVPLSETELVPLLMRCNLTLAAVNHPQRVVVSGALAALSELELELESRGVACRRLATSHAFHSPMMEPAAVAFLSKLSKIELRPPKIPFLSNVSGTWIKPEEAIDPSYWARHLLQTVRFSAGVRELLADRNLVLLEVGPGATLSGLVRKHPERSAETAVVSSLGDARENGGEVAELLGALGHLWVAGVEVDWRALHGEERRLKVELPLYPFERQLYSLEDRRQLEEASAAKLPKVSGWFYVPSWKLSPPLSSSFSGMPIDHLSCCLVLGDGGGLAAALAAQLRRGDRQVVTVGTAPSRDEDWKNLLLRLREEGRWPRAIIHLWSLPEVTPDDTPDASLDRCLERGFFSLLRLVRAIAVHGEGRALELLVVSTNLFGVEARDAPEVFAAPIAGLCHVIGQELPSISCRLVDVGPFPYHERDRLERAARRLVAELVARSSDAEVAHRENLRWVRSFDKLELEAGDAPVLRERGVYLITGGLGQIGLACAELLARKAKARLVLIGRSSFPRRDRWRDWLDAHPEEDPWSEKIRRLRALEEMGCEVRTFCADVGVEEQMCAVVAFAQQSFGALHGVIHAAGWVEPEGFRWLMEMEEKEVELHFRSKLHGTLALEKALEGRELDFCLLFSSLSSILGGLGFGAYAAANAFLDAFAEARHRAGDRRFTSIAWEGWQFDTPGWEPRVGLGAHQTELALTPSEGIEALDRALRMIGLPRLVISTGEIENRRRRWGATRAVPVVEETSDLPAPEPDQRPELTTLNLTPQAEIERTLAKLWQQALDIAQIGLEDNLLELGADSLLAIWMLADLQRIFEVNLSLRVLFEHPTIAGQAAAIAELRAASPSVFRESVLVRDNSNMVEQLRNLGQLSDEDVETLLEAEGSGRP